MHDDDGDELRLFVEQICCDLFRFLHAAEFAVDHDQIRIEQEIWMGKLGVHADLFVHAPNTAPYFVEVKWRYSIDRIVESLARKFGPTVPPEYLRGARRVVLVCDDALDDDWAGLMARVRPVVRPDLEIEVWNEAHLLRLVREQFGVPTRDLAAHERIALREAIDLAKARHAFGGADTTLDALESSLLWHFGFWKLRALMRANGGDRRAILEPGRYERVIAVMADLTAFSAYVRDTRDDRIIRDCLTAFYAKSRTQILSNGGMCYQFLGDAVIGLFGVPDGTTPETFADAMRCAELLVQIGNSVSNEWQRRIDHIQDGRGVHLGMAVGSMNFMSLRPFSRVHMGAIGESINLAARLMHHAASGEVVISNSLYQQLPRELQRGFTDIPAVEARNMGRIKAWRKMLDPADPPAPDPRDASSITPRG